MKNAKQLTLPNISKAFMDLADVLLVLDDGAVVPCHSQTLAMHSAVLCNMFSDLAGQRNEKIRIPLAEITEAQCSALLGYLYGMSGTGAAFKEHNAAAFDAAAAVARFAHTFDAPHVLEHIEGYMAAFLEENYKTKEEVVESGGSPFTFIHASNWAVMAEKFDMHQVHSQCKRAMVMYWEYFQDNPHLVDPLSRGALQRIAKGLHGTLLASTDHPSSHVSCSFKAAGKFCTPHKYPPVQDFIPWNQQKTPTTQ